MSRPDIRWIQRFQNYQKALVCLTEAVELSRKRPLSELEMQGLVQAYEFTHELAWNTLKDFLESRGAKSLYGSKDATRDAFAKGLIENGEIWMAMIRDRNQSTHTYNMSVVRAIVASITTDYIVAFTRLQERMRDLEAEELAEEEQE
jgi:nucleotidyltransferase substrate binding protein (TIGR01987 family)